MTQRTKQPSAAQLAAEFARSSNSFARIEQSRPRIPSLSARPVPPEDPSDEVDPLEQTVDISADVVQEDNQGERVAG